MAEGDGINGSAAAKASAAPETQDAPPATETKDAPAPAVDEADVLEEDDDFEEFEEDRTFSSSCAFGFWSVAERFGRSRVQTHTGGSPLSVPARGANGVAALLYPPHALGFTVVLCGVV